MIVHCEYQLYQGDRVSILGGGMAYEPEDPFDEAIPFGTPKCWDETFLQRVNMEKYTILHICGKLVAHGCYNAVTDHGKVWKLTGISEGDFDGSYHMERGKVYCGIQQGEGERAFLSDASATILLLPKGTEAGLRRLLLPFQENRVEDYTGAEAARSMQGLAECISGSIALVYSMGHGGWLTMYGENVETISTHNDLDAWPTCDPELVFRRGL